MNNYSFSLMGQTFSTTSDQRLGWAFGQIIDGQPQAPSYCADKNTAMRQICDMTGDRYLKPLTES